MPRPSPDQSHQGVGQSQASALQQHQRLQPEARLRTRVLSPGQLGGMQGPDCVRTPTRWTPVCPGALNTAFLRVTGAGSTGQTADWDLTFKISHKRREIKNKFRGVGVLVHPGGHCRHHWPGADKQDTPISPSLEARAWGQVSRSFPVWCGPTSWFTGGCLLLCPHLGLGGGEGASAF